MKIDKSNLRKIILDFPKQFRIGLKSAENIKISHIRTFEHSNLVICGIGGSALPADILNIWLEENTISPPVKINRNYGLPYYVNQKHLVICISYSGNTEETLTAFEEARKRKLNIAAITSGGKLAELCEFHKIPAAIVPSGVPARMALGWQFAALMKILANSGLIRDAHKEIYGLENLLSPAGMENQGKKIAKELKGKIPLIYASSKMAKLARIWKFKFNENTKFPAFYNYFPELNHQEHNQFEGNRNDQFSVIILRDKTDHPRILKRMNLLAEILLREKVKVQFIDIDNGNMLLYRIFNNVLLSDWVSYYLALEYKIDPTPVKFNDEFKKLLAE